MKSTDAEDVYWGFVEGMSAVIDGVRADSIVGPASEVAHAVMTAAQGLGREALIENPYFIGNGHGDGDRSRVTASYLRSRRRKNVAKGVSGAAGQVGSMWTQVDVSGIALHGNAVGTTAAHLRVLSGMARRSRRTGTVADWLDIVIRMKSIKLATRGAGLAGAAIPIPALGIATGLVGAAVSAGANLTLSKACVAAAVEMHWRARQEQFMSSAVTGGGTGGSVGPASRIVWELFTKRGITRILGKYDIKGIVNEPAGWMAISDKL
ncbi:MAG: hypothetical protein AAGA20_04900, partial [Planctomycetota bacterium]